MPVLNNPRWELFAQNRAEGMSISQSYLLAGFATKDKMVAFANGARLLRNAHVRARLRELLDFRAETTIVTKESLAAELDQAAEQAALLDQPSVIVQAAMAKAKLFGLEAPSKSLNLNVYANFNGMTEDELQFELASMLNEVRGAAGKQPVALPSPEEKKH